MHYGNWSHITQDDAAYPEFTDLVNHKLQTTVEVCSKRGKQSQGQSTELDKLRFTAKENLHNKT